MVRNENARLMLYIKIGYQVVTMKYSFYFLSLSFLSIALTSCAVGPDFKKQTPWYPSKWYPNHNSIHGNVTSQISKNKLDPNWWECFHDPILSDLERRTIVNNLDIQMATQRMIASRAQLIITGSARFPTLNAMGSYSRAQHSSKMARRIINRVENQKPELGKIVDPKDIDIPTFNEWADALDSSWEADIWGRVRRQYEAGKALWQVSEEERRDILTLQLAEVANDYITLRGLQTQLDIVRKNAKIAQDSLDLAQKRYTGGLVTELDVHDARAQLEQTNAQIPQLEEQVINYMNALALLMGEPPRALDQTLSQQKPIPPVPPQIPVGLPSELLQRRPDVREAEAALHVATAEVGVAEGDFYPKVTVDAKMGFQSLSIKDLGFWSARAWNVGPTISIPIFEGGKLKGQLQLKKAQQKEAALAYRKTVLRAWQEVDNALSAYQAEQLRNDKLRETVNSNQQSVFLAQEQYREGLQTFINVLDAERRLLQSQDDLVKSTTRISTNLVQLYKALGGGWETTFPEHTESLQKKS